MVAFFPKGEIIGPVDVISPEIASGLGSRVLSAYNNYSEAVRFFGNNSGLSIDEIRAEETEWEGVTNRVRLSEEDAGIVALCVEAMRSRLPAEVKFNISYDFFVGQAAGGRWHVDGDRDIRGLVNLSASPAQLEVALSWKKGDYGGAVSKYDMFAYGMSAEPTNYETKTLGYGPGQGIGINNLARSDRQVPHRAVKSDNRIVLRLFADIV